MDTHTTLDYKKSMVNCPDLVGFIKFHVECGE